MTEPKSKSEVLSKTTLDYLHTIHREVKYKLFEEYGNKYIDKGHRMEDDSLTLLSQVKGYVIDKNTVRLKNDFITGEADTKTFSLQGKHGFDVKTVWDLWTLPFATDKLNPDYYWQNLGYIALNEADSWSTCYCLVNSPADAILSEKNKVYYALGQPDDTNEYYMRKRLEIEKNMIFDMAKFKRDNPNFDLDFDIVGGWEFDIPANERVVEFTVERNDADIERLYERIKVCREYLNTL
jgi:hypothetical protein